MKYIIEAVFKLLEVFIWIAVAAGLIASLRALFRVMFGV